MFIRQIIDVVGNSKNIFSLLHLVGLRRRVYYTLTKFRGGQGAPLPPPQYANVIDSDLNTILFAQKVRKPKWLPCFKLTGAIFSLRSFDSRVFVFTAIYNY